MANLLTKFFGRTASEGAAFALGLATGPVLYPAVREIESLAWQQYQSRPVDAATAAEIVAEDVEKEAWGETEAASNGINRERFQAMVGEVLTAPGAPELLTLRRRNLIDDTAFTHGLRKAKLELQWDDALRSLADVLLSPADLANAVVQGHMDQNTAAHEAALQGYSADRFGVLVENTGLPPGPQTLVEWRRRGFIDDGELDQGIREGHTKTKYIPFFHDALNAQLSTAQIVGLRVKGWITPEESYTLGAGHGFSPAQMDQLWEEAGRPATPHQIHIGYARGASVAGAANEEDAIRQSVERSDLQTRYEDVIYAGRYTYPPFFALRTLAQSGALDQAQLEQILKYEGWEPNLAHLVAVEFTKPAAKSATADPYITKADGQLWTAAHKAYVKTGLDRSQVEPTLTKIVPDAATRNAVFDLWTAERDIDAVKPPATAPVTP